MEYILGNTPVIVRLRRAHIKKAIEVACLHISGEGEGSRGEGRRREGFDYRS